MLFHESEQSPVVLLYLLVITGPAAPTICPIKFLVFDILGTTFLKPKSGCHHENQLVLGLGLIPKNENL